jgi:hypothetical protein
MQVDQPGGRKLAGGIEQAQCACRGNVGFERLDQAIADADVAPAAQRLARVEHLRALDHEVELVVRPHGGGGGAGDRGGQCECAGASKKFATRLLKLRLDEHGLPPTAMFRLASGR